MGKTTKCDLELCLFLDQVCGVNRVLKDRPILRDCPCKECIVRPICKQKCNTRVEYVSYLINHLYEESKARLIIKLAQNLEGNERYDYTEDMHLVSNPDTYDVTLRL